MTATSTYRVDGLVAGLAIKAPCIAVTNAAITLSGEQTVNSVAVVENDRVLVKDQADASENGIYWCETGAWTRAADFDGNRDATTGTLVVYATSSTLVGFYQLTATNPVVIGTTELTFTLVATLDLAGVLASTDTNKGASQVAVEDSAGNLTATTVEAALAEIFAGTAGSWTPNFLGFSSAPTTTVYWRRSGNIVTLRFAGGSGTSNSTNFTIDNVPAAIQPAINQSYPIIGLVDNGVDLADVSAVRLAGANINFGLDGSNPNGLGWTASGTKGFQTSNIFVSYSLGAFS